MTTPSDPNKAQGVTPDGLANQLFDIAMTQTMAEKITDPREAARRVVGFLTDSLYYAVTSTKQDFVVYLTETLIFAVSSSSGGDEAARKELLKHIGDTIANAPPLPSKPAAGKP